MRLLNQSLDSSLIQRDWKSWMWNWCRRLSPKFRCWTEICFDLSRSLWISLTITYFDAAMALSFTSSNETKISFFDSNPIYFLRTQIGSESDDKLQLKIDFKHVNGLLRDNTRRQSRSIMTFGEEALGTTILFYITILSNVTIYRRLYR